MSQPEAGSTAQVAVVLTEQRPSFLDGKIDLKSLHLALKRESKTAIEALAAVLNDPEAGLKLRKEAAVAVLDLQVRVAAEMNKDSLQRLIAEMKLNPQGRKMLTDANGNGDDDTPPMVDFDNIQSIGD